MAGIIASPRQEPYKLYKKEARYTVIALISCHQDACSQQFSAEGFVLVSSQLRILPPMHACIMHPLNKQMQITAVKDLLLW